MGLEKFDKKLESQEWIIWKFRLPSGGWQLSIIKFYPYFFNLLSLIFHQINPLSRILTKVIPYPLFSLNVSLILCFFKTYPLFFPNLLLIFSILSLIPFFVHTPVNFLIYCLSLIYIYLFIYIYLWLFINLLFLYLEGVY